MSFGGAVSAMVTSLKNNKRKRPSAYEKMEKYNGNYDTKLHFDKKATTEELETIRKKLQNQHKKELLIKIIGLVILTFVIIFFIW